MAEKTVFQHIMVLVDSTESSAAAVMLAARLAKNQEARLTGLHAIENETLQQLFSAKVLLTTEMDEFEGALMESGERHLARAVKRAAKLGVKMETKVVSGNSGIEIPRVIADEKVDLLVVGEFDSAQLRFDLLFRQRQQMLDHAQCAVLVAR